MSVSVTSSSSTVTAAATSSSPPAAVVPATTISATLSGTVITAAVSPLAAPTVPGQPAMNDACFGGQFTTITFFPPANNGGSPILGYDLWVDNTPYLDWAQGTSQGFYPDVAAAPAVGGQWEISIPEDIEGLDVTVRAYNAVGYGSFAADVAGQFC